MARNHRRVMSTVVVVLTMVNMMMLSVFASGTWPYLLVARTEIYHSSAYLAWNGLPHSENADNGSVAPFVRCVGRATTCRRCVDCYALVGRGRVKFH